MEQLFWENCVTVALFLLLLFLLQMSVTLNEKVCLEQGETEDAAHTKDTL